MVGSSDSDVAFRRGCQLYDQEKWTDSETFFRSAITDMSNGEAFFRLSNVLDRLAPSTNEEARALLSHAASLGHQKALINYSRILCFTDRNFTEAKKLIWRAVQIREVENELTYRVALFNGALIFEEAGQYHTAVIFLDRCAKGLGDPDIPEDVQYFIYWAQLMKGIWQSSRKSFDTVQETFQSLLELRDSSAACVLASLCLDNEEYEKALHWARLAQVGTQQYYPGLSAEKVDSIIREAKTKLGN